MMNVLLTQRHKEENNVHQFAELPESCERKGRGIIQARGVMMGQPTETAGLSSQDLMDTGPNIREPAWLLT